MMARVRYKRLRSYIACNIAYFMSKIAFMTRNVFILFSSLFFFSFFKEISVVLTKSDTLIFPGFTPNSIAFVVLF